MNKKEHSDASLSLPGLLVIRGFIYLHSPCRPPRCQFEVRINYIESLIIRCLQNFKLS